MAPLPDPDQKALVLKYQDFARRLAFDVVQKVGGAVRLEEARSAATLGLIEAAARFDPTVGAQFQTFAYYRIRGAVLDELRSDVRENPGLRARLACESALDAMLEAEGNGSSPQGVDDRVHAAEELSRVLENAASAVLAQSVLHEEVQNREEHAVSPEERAATRQLAALIREALQVLPEPERTVLMGVYLEGKSLDEVGAPLGFSRSWTSRVSTRGLALLRARLAAALGEP